MQLRLALIACLVGLALAAPSTTKIDRGLAKSFANGKVTANILVKFQGGNSPAINRVSKFKTLSRASKINLLVADLKSLAKASQQNAQSLLKARAPFSSSQQLWVTNQLYVKGASAQLVQQLAALPEVEEIHEESIIALNDPSETEIGINAEWNIERIKAHEAWALPGGNNGQGVVVANIDTGVRATHEALRNNYRADHGWFDPYDGSEEASDSNGHGSHTMGVLVGANGIGVAPGAQWISCRGCSTAACSEAALIQCGQFMVCPTNPDGQGEDCTKAPNVVSNSWGGGQGNTFYDAVIDAWVAIDIVPIFAVGNSGPSCGSASSPADNEKVIAVGSITSSDLISGSSSAGPSVRGLLKPDIAAPGQSIRSAWGTGDNAYQTISGTSMATPHVAGTAALLLSHNPNLTYPEVKRLLLDNADKNVPDTGRVCDGIPSTEIPNHQYGHGIVNARRALEAAINSH